MTEKTRQTSWVDDYQLNEKTEKTRQFNVYADPSHAWVKVKLDTLIALGIADQISDYSYQRKSKNNTRYVYLEEDRDALIFWNALTKKGITPVFNEKHTDSQSKIRNYESYSPPAKNTTEVIPPRSRPKMG
jgi:hypothetical protein